MDRELLVTLKALSDATRLRIAGLLVARPHSVEDLEAVIDLSTGTVVHHLERLRAAGLVDTRPSQPSVVYFLRLDALQRLGRQLDEIEHSEDRIAPTSMGVDGEPLAPYDARTIRAFVVDGRLSSIPVHGKKRDVILRFLLDRCFGEDRAYPEKEVNQRLALYHPDVAALRRYLVDGRLMTREAGVYRRAVAAAEPRAEAVDGEPGAGRQREPRPDGAVELAARADADPTEA